MVDEPPHGLLLGWTEPHAKRRPTEFPQDVWANADEGHLVTVAPTGAGKGVSCIIPALLTWQGPAIVIDPKGENYAVTARRRKELGQSVHVLDPFGVTHASRRAGINPLDLIDTNSDSYEDDRRFIANLMVQGLVFKSDPFWDERAVALIMEAIAYVVEDLMFPSLIDVRTVIDSYAGLPVHKYWNPQPDSSYAHPRIAKVFNPVGMSVERTRASIAATACSHLTFIHQGAVARSLEATTFSLDALKSGRPMTIYLVLPPDKLITHGKLLRLWLGVLLRVLTGRIERPPIPTLLLVDEAAQFGPLDELRTAITLMRGYGVRVWTFWQDLSQLRRTYPDDWESLLNNCATHQYFGAMMRFSPGPRIPHANFGLTLACHVLTQRPSLLETRLGVGGLIRRHTLGRDDYGEARLRRRAANDEASVRAYAAAVTEPPCPLLWRSRDSTYELLELIHPAHLYREGEEAGNCLATEPLTRDAPGTAHPRYWKQVHRGDRHIYSLRHEQAIAITFTVHQGELSELDLVDPPGDALEMMATCLHIVEARIGPLTFRAGVCALVGSLMARNRPHA